MSALPHAQPQTLGSTSRPLAALGLSAAAAAFAAGATVFLGPPALALPFAVAIGVVLVRQPMALYAAVLFIGVFKEQSVFQALPDVTVALVLLLGAVCGHRLLTGRARTVPPLFAGLLLVFALLLMISLIWTPIPVYGTEKAMRFATITMISALAPFCLIESREDLERLLKILAVGALLTAPLVLLLGTSSSDARLEFGGEGNTIGTSRFLLTGATILVLGSGLGLWRRYRLPVAVAGLLLMAVAAGVGSRGPFVALALALVCTVVAIVLRQPQRLLPVILVIVGAVALLPLISLPATSAERLQGVVQDPAGTLQEDLRSKLYHQAIEITRDHPVVGIGAGGFFQYGYLITYLEERYPHNMFLEASSELGLGPALLLAVSVLAMLAGLYRRAWATDDERYRALLYVFGAAFLMAFFAGQFTGDFNDNRDFWAMLGIGFLIARHGLSEAAAEIPSEDRQVLPRVGR